MTNITGYSRLLNRFRRMRSRFRSSSFVLLYHRIAEVEHDPWGLCVSPLHFEEHLEVLRSHGRPVVSASGLGRTAAPANAIAITFDDGYLDNLEVAAPALERAGMPATFFVTTGCIGQTREFWWDELEKILLSAPELPARLDLTIGARDMSWTSGGLAPAQRGGLYRTLWELLFRLTGEQRAPLLDSLLEWSGASPHVRASHKTLSLSELLRLGGSELREIGAHTLSHPALPNLPVDGQRREIEGSKATLEEILGRPIHEISYPHGRRDAVTIELARMAALTRGYTTDRNSFRAGEDPLNIPRVCVGDWNGDEFARQLRVNFGV